MSCRREPAVSKQYWTKDETSPQFTASGTNVCVCKCVSVCVCVYQRVAKENVDVNGGDLSLSVRHRLSLHRIVSSQIRKLI